MNFLPTLLAGKQYALAVSTVEPRKNYGLLLRCWQRFCEASTGVPLDLVIVGRSGAGAGDIEREILAHPLLNKHVFWLDICSDTLLSRLYEAAHVVLYPSFVEGWGLPVTEALGYGREVIASDSAAIPEAAFGLATLLDPRNEEAWVAAIHAAAARPRRCIAAPALPTWESAAADVLRGLVQLRSLDGREAA